MIDDDARDAIALIRACLEDDMEASQVIYDHCDLVGVLAIITGIATQGLIEDKGEDGTREWLTDLRAGLT
jgi:hypothetical protein